MSIILIMINALSFDLEDYYQVEAFKGIVKYQDWPTYPGRVEPLTIKLLDLLSSNNIAATFFILGWQAEQTPELIRRIARGGHEIASHGYSHQIIAQQTPEQFRECVRKSKHILENITGRQVKGYRAPTFSITKETMWALDILIEEGYLYDSSIFPIHHDRYGIPGFGRFPRKLERSPGKAIMEIPVSTSRIMGIVNFPFSGGGYFRFLPYFLTQWAIKGINRRNHPAFLYFHPWEFDPEQPRMPVGRAAAFRHYYNLAANQQKLLYLFEDFKFSTYINVVDSIIREP
ncbi:MAG: XrtA system polysaccharide deacetylase [bacterium]